MRRVLILVIRFYRIALSPFLGNNCRFYPTCSAYAETAVNRYGAITGGWLSVKRICRCHPWHPGGIDPVPERSKAEQLEKQA